jgi:hypothetical protein
MAYSENTRFRIHIDFSNTDVNREDEQINCQQQCVIIKLSRFKRFQKNLELSAFTADKKLKKYFPNVIV